MGIRLHRVVEGIVKWVNVVPIHVSIDFPVTARWRGHRIVDSSDLILPDLDEDDWCAVDCALQHRNRHHNKEDREDSDLESSLLLGLLYNEIAHDGGAVRAALLRSFLLFLFSDEL